jgi:hypothetical protein
MSATTGLFLWNIGWGRGGIKNWSNIKLIRIFVLKLRQKEIKLKLQCKIGKKIQNLNKNLVKI